MSVTCMSVKCVGRHALVWLLLTPLFAAASLQEPFKITDNVDLVLLDASVRNNQGGYVTDLSKDNFHVFVDGHPQQISQFARVDAPVTVGLIVDNSGSMRFKRPSVIMAGLAFAKASNPQDQFFVVNFNNEVLPGLPKAMPFTDNITALHKAMYMGDPGGQTALYDAIAYGLKHLESGDRDQRTLIVVSDGGDNVSELKEHAILDLIEQSRATIYTIGLLDPEDRDLRPGILKKFASISGGEYFQPAKLEDVLPVMRKISNDIRNRYTIGFSPAVASTSGGKHNFAIKVTATEDGHKLQVRARTSYTLDPKPVIQETSLRDWR